MNRNVYAEIRLAGPAKNRPTGRFLVQARLSSDDDSAPYGHWSLAVEPLIQSEPGAPLPPEFPASIAFVSNEAPHSALAEPARIELFFGVSRVGIALPVQQHDELPSDEAFLLFETDAA